MLSFEPRIALLVSAALCFAACSTGAKEEEMGMANATPAPAGAPMQGSAEYTLILKSTWTKANHPFEYPVTGPHFSGIIGASHNTSYALFRDGSVPTPGLERLSEEGKHTPLDEEIRSAVAAGNAGVMIASGPLKDFGDSLVTTVRVDAEHPLVSLVAMVAPSPDWFTGVSALNLMENGEWVASKTLQLHAWDSGGDDGATYKAADRNTDPKKPTTQAGTRHFVTNGAAVPVATLTLIKK